MKYLVAHYDYDDVEVKIAEVPEALSKKIFELLDYEVLASGDFNSKEKHLDVIKKLENLMWTEKTQAQAEKEWESSKKTKEYYSKLAVTFSGSVMPVDYLTKEQYLDYVKKETLDAVKHNKEVKKILEELK